MRCFTTVSVDLGTQQCLERSSFFYALTNIIEANLVTSWAAEWLKLTEEKGLGSYVSPFKEMERFLQRKKMPKKIVELFLFFSSKDCFSKKLFFQQEFDEKLFEVKIWAQWKETAQPKIFT